MKKPTPVQPHNCATCGGVEPLYAHHSPGDCIATLRAENERLREHLAKMLGVVAMLSSDVLEKPEADDVDAARAALKGG